MFKFNRSPRSPCRRLSSAGISVFGKSCEAGHKGRFATSLRACMPHQSALLLLPISKRPGKVEKSCLQRSRGQLWPATASGHGQRQLPDEQGPGDSPKRKACELHCLPACLVSLSSPCKRGLPSRKTETNRCRGQQPPQSPQWVSIPPAERVETAQLEAAACTCLVCQSCPLRRCLAGTMTVCFQACAKAWPLGDAQPGCPSCPTWAS